MQVARPALHRQVRMQVITSWTGGQADTLRQALRMTNESFAEYLGVAARTIAYWRKNPEITPTPKIQEALDTALERAPDRAKAQFAALIGQAEHDKQPGQVESFEVPGGALLGASPGADPEFGDSDYLQSIRKHIREIVALDNRFGGADLVKLSKRFFRTLHQQLGTGTYDPNLERDLQSAAAELAEVVGWLAYDAEAHDLTRRMNQESLYFARLAGDKTIELLTLQNSSMHAASQGRPREALQIARSVLEGNYRLSSRIKALFLTRKARALAQGGDHSTLRLFPEIRSLYHEGVSDEDPAWAWWIDERELAWHEAMAQRDLGMPERAIAQFERSLIATPATEIRSQYLHRAYLLQAQVDNAVWDEAEQSIRQLLPLSTEVASTRTVVLLRKVLSQLAINPKVPSTLQQQVTMLNAALDQAPV
jgi:transcriptional regulator with XRE-family HTH domain